MREPDPEIETIQLTDVNEPMLRLVSKVSRSEARVVVESDGEPVAALVSAADLRRLTQLDLAWDQRTRVIERFSQAFADVPADDVEAEVASIIERQRASRAENEARQPA
ncbi:MAG: type II toxin-antitoxin system prevent-host-death family antitoxin [Thermomicrobiales bacterium]